MAGIGPTTSESLQAGLRRLQVARPNARQLLDVPRSWGRVQRGFVDVCKRLTAGLAPWPLFVHGDVGTGKTRAGLCLCDIVPGALYWPTDLVSAVAFKPDDFVWEAARNASLIVVDELATANHCNDYEYNGLKRLLDIRDRGDGRVGVYISNLPPDRLRQYFDDRIASRLLCGTIYEFGGNDQRMVRQ